MFTVALLVFLSLQEVDQQVDEVIFDHVHSLAYQGTPLGRTILGPTKNIQLVMGHSISFQQLFWGELDKTWYKVSTCGRVKPDNILYTFLICMASWVGPVKYLLKIL